MLTGRCAGPLPSLTWRTTDLHAALPASARLVEGGHGEHGGLHAEAGAEAAACLTYAPPAPTHLKLS